MQERRRGGDRSPARDANGARSRVAGSGIAFDDRGEHSLKGVPDSWALYAARAERLSY